MNPYVEQLLTQLRDAFPHLAFTVEPNPTLWGIYFLDVYSHKEHLWSLEVHTDTLPVKYGLSIIDQDTTPFDQGADLMFAHQPTLLKYCRLLFPKP